MASPTDDDASSGNAASNVFGTVELLEHIICEMPWQDILVNASRVSFTWNKIMKTSPQIRQKLHVPAKTTTVISPRSVIKEEDNRFRVLYDQDFKLNPHLKPLPSVVHGGSDGIVHAGPTIRELHIFAFHPAMIMHMYKHSSCLAMFLTEPPCTTMRFGGYIFNTFPTKSGEAGLLLHEPKGITVGRALKAVMGDVESRISLPALAQPSMPQLFYGVLHRPLSWNYGKPEGD
jgi:hypothetical protein